MKINGAENKREINIDDEFAEETTIIVAGILL